MSKNRENIIWQSKDGSWSIGFYTVIPGDYTDPDYDDEWDVDYDFSSFEFASVGHPDSDSAMNAWSGANPGMHHYLSYSRANAKEIAVLDEYAKRCLCPEYAKKALMKEYRKHVSETAAQVKKTIEEQGIKDGTRVILTGGSAGGPSNRWNTVLKQEGEWLVGTSSQKKPKKFRVYNTVTGKVWRGTYDGRPTTIGSITRYKAPAGYGYRGFYQ